MKKLPLLLAKPNSLMRQTVVLTAGSIQIGPVFQASTLRMAHRMVLEQPFAAIIVPLCWDDETTIGPVLEFIAAVRSGSTRCASTVPIFVTASACSIDEAQGLAALHVQRILLKPFKARLLIEALAELSRPAQISPSTSPHLMAMSA